MAKEIGIEKDTYKLYGECKVIKDHNVKGLKHSNYHLPFVSFFPLVIISVSESLHFLMTYCFLRVEKIYLLIM